MKKHLGNRARFYLLYTAIFVVAAYFSYRYFFIAGKTFIRERDGWTQHYKSLVFYSRWLRMAVGNLLKGKFSVPAFSFSIGFGADAMTTLHYYAIGDPLNLLSVFVPARYMVHFYGLLILIRIYLSGITFSAYCFYQKRYGNMAVMAGTFVYSFCNFAMWGSVRHPYFMNPMVYFPLILLGVDKLVRDKKPWVFILAVAVSGASNFYFFYMLVMLTVFYVFGKFVLTRKRTVRQSAMLVLRIGVCGLIGVALAAVILLPVILLFLNCSRPESGYVVDLFYPFSYYKQCIPFFLTYGGSGYYTRLGFSVIALSSVFLLLFVAGKERLRLKAALVVGTSLLLIPAAAYFLNGMAYVSNRWVWGFAMLIAYVVVDRWDAHFGLPANSLLFLTVLTAFYVRLSTRFVTGARRNLKFALLLEIAVLLVLWLWREGSRLKGKKVPALFLFGISLLSIAGNAYFGTASNEKAYINDFLDFSAASVPLTDAKGAAAAEADELCREEVGQNEFYRYSSDNLSLNDALLNGTSNTQFYWSLSDSKRYEFWKQMGLPESNTSNYQGLDSRAALNALGSVGYFVTEQDPGLEKYVPYGFAQVKGENGEEAIGGYHVYCNEMALPLGYTYTNTLSREEYDRLDSVQKQEALLQGVLLSGEAEGFEDADIELGSKELDYDIVCEDDSVTREGDSFVVTEPGATVFLKFDSPENSETYLDVDGLEYEGVSRKKLYNDDKSIDPLDRYTPAMWEQLTAKEKKALNKNDRNWETPSKILITVASGGVKRTIYYGTEQYQWRNDRHNFCLNLGYKEGKRTQIRIRFPELGTYRFDSLKVICQPMDSLAGQVEALREDVLEDLDMHNDNSVYVTDLLTGRISLDEPKILCLSIPYSTGWIAWVDGEKEELLRANTMFMALPLSEGEHSIRLEYHTPGKRAGMLLGVLGLLSMAGIWAVQRKNARRVSLEGKG